MGGASPDRSRHVAVFAFPYGTHAAPLLNLVVKLAHAAPHVSFSFFTTPQSKHSLLSSKLSNTIPENIRFYTVSDGITDGLDLTNHHPSRRLNFFLEAGPQNLKQGLSMAVSERNLRVTCVISDAFVTSSLVLAQENGVPWIALWTSYTCSLSAHFHTQLIREKHRVGGGVEDGSLAFINPGFSKMRIQDLPESIILKGKDEEEESAFSKMLASMGRVLPEAEAVVVNFYEELDPPLMVQDLRSKMKSLIYVGFLNLSLTFRQLPPPPPANTDKTGSLSWLDQHSAKSLVYISLGTVVSPPRHEVVAIAEALEELEGVPFLWSLKDDSKAFLPKGFLERTSEKGKVVPWAPQTLVLGHESVGAFVTHGGCNSVSESLSSGVPMICRPYFGDQLMAARMVEDVWGVGVKIEGGLFTKNALIRSLNRVLKQPEGKVMRDKAEELKNVVTGAAGQNGKTERAFNTLVEKINLLESSDESCHY
ncbi:anthocyanidin 3-O-glucosyltransferase 7-like [Prosopis cineraria]|uniref:anthocyanidin 3-O-glucosyltransferase 7-like n=1 Tax=Prosopis cineraria TaxID=364024 RepID=UPI002410B4F6|nr:anthocyanidin 3-O-glucosyltransferase 7-like [Prosopis cineraria]